ncbi:MAG: hypothetical protein ACOC10_11345 [Bacteroidota bacterium]
MAQKKSMLRMVLICVTLLWYNHPLFAQTEIQPLHFEQDSIRLKKYNLDDDLSFFLFSGAGENRFFDRTTPEINNYQFVYQFKKKQLPKTILVTNNNLKTFLPGLGSIEHFTTQFRWYTGKNVTIDFRTGLAIQNTIMNPYMPNYQLSFRASVEYDINNWLTTYLYAQFISNPLNRADAYFDPFMSNNPLFLQNEIGGGLKANFNNKHIGLEVYSMPEHNFKSIRLNPTNSRIVIGF